jgi:hypothetical protein
MENESKLTPYFRPVTLSAPTCSTAFKIAVRSSFTAGLFLDKSPRLLDAKGAAMPGLMFMANGKEGKSNAPMQKKWSDERKVREETIFVAVPEKIRRPMYLE